MSRQAVIAAVAAMMAVASCPAFAAEPVTVAGMAKVIDGDTIDVAGQRVRIYGIDAPEAAQTCDRAGRTIPCGQEATDALARMVGRSQVTCTGNERDQYQRLIAVCRAGGIDLGAWMVEQGQAVAFVKYSSDYVAAEQAARQRKVGLWAMTFDMPWEYRRVEWEKRNGVQQVQAAPAGKTACLIKGNVNTKGEKIYHLPGGAMYAKTAIDTSAGERWFCSEAEAKAAGWRASRR